MSSDVRIDRVLKATIDRVYAAWTQPTLLSRWYCPNPALDLEVEADVRVGGAYVVTMGPYVARGVYTEVEPPKLLEFTWQWDHEGGPTQVRVELSEVADGTRLLLSHTGFTDPQDAGGHLEGWELELDRLDALVTTA
ncbi:SRPBCC family protein [Kribbella sp. CA-293567]|uniref:SRPBCC family protein n=1 Tax=Kribbella sp. CA-293567 TaxID=3002436 RepID=UPI0022DDF9CE|nr:SRPBCC domain-containing protein [Kribbella sp. CA-293567]WBQ06942.1 SRPBCC domain-containing protein [Kribbella sp. CA-293567]